MNLFLTSSAVALAGAFFALITGRSVQVSKRIACTFGIVAAVLAVCSGVLGLFATPERLSIATPFTFTTFSLQSNQLSCLFLIVINALALPSWIYGYSYFDEYRTKGIGTMGMFMNLFIASMNMLVMTDNAFWFLVFFELMSLTSYFLVIVEQDADAVRSGFLYFVMAHVGFLMIMISFLVMAGVTGSFEFADFRSTHFDAALASLVFILAFLGFGCKAGMIPFHSWLPLAHPAAPSNVSALMSGGMIKIGIFGIVKVGFDLLAASDCQLWWGIAVLAIGCISSVLGIVYAIAEQDIKRLLAYSSVENIGIILLGVGTGLLGVAIGQPALTAIALMAGLYHLLNHAMFKGLLFLGAGSVLYSTGTRDMEKMGGLGKLMPVTSLCFFIGALAISAIPPFNGFVSEWFAYQGFVTGALSGNAIVQVACVCCAVALAITGALAATCFVKAYGVSFLGKARSDVSREAREVPFTMRLAMVIMMIACVLLGVCAPWIAPVLVNVAAQTAGIAAPQIAEGAQIANVAASTTISMPLVAVLLAVAVLASWAVFRMKSTGGRTNRPDPWACGYNPTPDMPLRGSSVASETRMFFQPLYLLRDRVMGARPTFQSGYSGLVHVTDRIQDWGDFVIVEPVSKFVALVGRVSSKLEGGNFRVYITYVVAALVIFLIIAVIAVG